MGIHEKDSHAAGHGWGPSNVDPAQAQPSQPPPAAISHDGSWRESLLVPGLDSEPEDDDDDDDDDDDVDTDEGDVEGGHGGTGEDGGGYGNFLAGETGLRLGNWYGEIISFLFLILILLLLF